MTSFFVGHSERSEESREQWLKEIILASSLRLPMTSFFVGHSERSEESRE